MEEAVAIVVEVEVVVELICGEAVCEEAEVPEIVVVVVEEEEAGCCVAVATVVVVLVVEDIGVGC